MRICVYTVIYGLLFNQHHQHGALFKKLFYYKLGTRIKFTINKVFKGKN